MTRAYVGTRRVTRGSGKSLSMFHDMRQEVLRRGKKFNYKVVSNTEFAFKERPFGHFWKKPIDFKPELVKTKVDFFQKLATYVDTIFLIDEASIWMEQYEWEKMPKEILTRLKQTRKVNIHLLYTSQYFQIVAQRLQKFTDVVVQCSPYPKPSVYSFSPPPSPIWIQQVWRHPDYFTESVQKSIFTDTTGKVQRKYTFGTKFIWLAELKRTFPTFDTYEITS